MPPPYGLEDLFKNTFPLDGVSLEGFTRRCIWEMGKKKFYYPENQFPQAVIATSE